MRVMCGVHNLVFFRVFFFTSDDLTFFFLFFTFFHPILLHLRASLKGLRKHEIRQRQRTMLDFFFFFLLFNFTFESE